MANTLNAKAVRDLKSDELIKRVRELKEENMNLKLLKATGALENPARVRQIRRETARILTIANQRKAQA